MKKLHRQALLFVCALASIGAGVQQAPPPGIPVAPLGLHFADALTEAAYQLLNDRSTSASNVLAAREATAYRLLDSGAGRVPGSDAWQRSRNAVKAAVQARELFGQALEAQLRYLRSVEPRLDARKAAEARVEDATLSRASLDNQKNIVHLLMRFIG